MSRGLTAGFLAAADAGTVYPMLLASFDFQSAPVNVHTGVGDYVYGGVTYAGVGELGGIAAIEETEETRANGVSFRLNGIPSALVSSILSDDYRNRTCTVQLALFTSLTATSPVTAPAVLFVGRMDQAVLEDDGETASINLTAESRLIDLQRSRERRYTDEDQRANPSFTADLGLQYVAGLQDKQLMWGAHGVSTPSNDYDTSPIEGRGADW